MCVCTYRIATVRASVTQYVKGTTLHLCNGNPGETITRSGTYVHTCNVHTYYDKIDILNRSRIKNKLFLSLKSAKKIFFTYISSICNLKLEEDFNFSALSYYILSWLVDTYWLILIVTFMTILALVIKLVIKWLLFI